MHFFLGALRVMDCSEQSDDALYFVFIVNLFNAKLALGFAMDVPRSFQNR